MKSPALYSAFLLAGLCLKAAADPVTYSNPVLRGDYPDPSVIRTGSDYWATSTSSEWAPHFPILHSKDLVNWETAGAVFTEPPAWAAANFWAPELCAWKGRYYLYYVARKKGGPLAVAVASADKPDGPWTDHGPLVAQDAGSIDGMAIDDENGRRWLVWKEDGNSRNLPTILWAQPLDESGTKLTGERHELMRNDARWEGAVVEGPFLLRRDGWFYLFYAGNSCCGGRAEYAEGVARSRQLLGPWEKCPDNPIIPSNNTFRAPGHGSIVDSPDGRLWLLYHSYVLPTVVFTGREMVLDEVTFTAAGWPQVNAGKGPSASAPSPFGAVQLRKELRFADDFSSNQLRPGWQWPINRRPAITLKTGILTLNPGPGQKDAILARSVTNGDFSAEAEIEPVSTGTTAGLSACGDPGNLVTLEVSGASAEVWQTRGGKRERLAGSTLPRPAAHLRMEVKAGHQLTFSASPDGQTWVTVGDGDGGFLPPWDRAIRTALIASDGEVRFTRFATNPAPR